MCAGYSEVLEHLRRWRRGKFVRLALRLESFHAMLAVAERLLFGKAAAAKADLGTPHEAVFIAVLILNREIALDPNRAVIRNRNFG